MTQKVDVSQEKDGIREEYGEYAVWVAGELVGYASTQGKAWEMYRENWRVRREHRERGNV